MRLIPHLLDFLWSLFCLQMQVFELHRFLHWTEYIVCTVSSIHKAAVFY